MFCQIVLFVKLYFLSNLFRQICKASNLNSTNCPSSNCLSSKSPEIIFTYRNPRFVAFNRLRMIVLGFILQYSNVRFFCRFILRFYIQSSFYVQSIVSYVNILRQKISLGTTITRLTAKVINHTFKIHRRT